MPCLTGSRLAAKGRFWAAWRSVLRTPWATARGRLLSKGQGSQSSCLVVSGAFLFSNPGSPGSPTLPGFHLCLLPLLPLLGFHRTEPRVPSMMSMVSALPCHAQRDATPKDLGLSEGDHTWPHVTTRQRFENRPCGLLSRAFTGLQADAPHGPWRPLQPGRPPGTPFRLVTGGPFRCPVPAPDTLEGTRSGRCATRSPGHAR